jgi:cytochrome P450
VTTAEERNRRSEAESFDLFNLPGDYFDAPERWLRLLRDHDPMHRNSDGTVLLTRYHDVRTVWRDRSTSVDKSEMFRAKFGEGPLLEHHTTGMLFRDPPDHDRLRVLVNSFFEPASLERLRPFITELVDRLLDDVAGAGAFDFVTDFAEKIPVSLITRILGVPPEDGRFLRPIGLRVLFPLNPRVSREAIDDGHAAVAEFKAYILEHIRRLQRRGVDGEPANVLEALVAGQAAGREVSVDEIVHMCLLMFNGGQETTTNLMSGAALALLDHPDQYAVLPRLEGPELRVAGEEILRYVTPLQLQGRRTTTEIDLPSGPLTPGTEVILCQASANRDERAFPDPDRLDLGRRPNAHVAFGMGIHACVGNQLVRLQSSIVLPQVARRLPTLHRSGPVEFNPNARFRGLRRFPVES